MIAMNEIKSFTPAKRVRVQAGATLIEVLVAIFVMAIAMLGVASLQALALKYQQGAWSRASVAVIINDYAERVRSNPGRNDLVLIAPYLRGANYEVQQANLIPVAAVDCAAAPCNANQLATWDMNRVLTSASTLLPGVALQTVQIPNSGFSATLMWFDKDNVDNAGNLLTTPVCDAATTGAAARVCCPAAAAAPAGVRCINTVVVP
jgi:type IV pilus assembly protein PilV